MDSQLDWRLIYSDEIAALYARAGSSAAHIAGVPIYGPRYHADFP
jgi:hypothetical protein